MLTWITPSGFKSFAPDAEKIPFERFTLLVGANGSGKSNLFDLIRLFQGLATGLTMPEILHGVRRSGREVWPGIRGQANLTFGSDGDASPEVSATMNGVGYIYGLLVGGDSPGVDTEHFGGGTPRRWVIVDEAHVGQEGIVCAADDNWRASGPAIYLEGNRGSLLLGRTRTPELIAISPDPAPLRTFLQSSQLIELSPARMREYASRGTTVIGAEGDGLSAVLREIASRPESKAELLDWLTELCAPAVRDIDFIEVEGTGDVLFRLHEEDGTTVTAQSVSDGTLRFLGLLAALWSVPEHSLICLEEVEQGLHPARIDLLVELILQACDRRNLQVIATTHSPRVLHALGQQSPELLAGAVVFGRTPDVKGTVTRRLGDLPSFDDVRQNRGIEHLFTSRWLERAL